MIRALAILAALICSLVPFRAPVAGADCGQAQGAVIRLSGTPHLWVRGEDGAVHWVGDTRALADHPIDWNTQCSLGLDELQGLPSGDPWLSSGLVKVGDSIYLSKWELTEPAPVLLHIQSLRDVELFGINGSNYSTFVLDRDSWEQLYGFNVGSLQVGPLAAAASVSWPATDQAAYAQLLMNTRNVLSFALIGAQRDGTDVASALATLTSCEQQGLGAFDRDRNADSALGATQDCLAHRTSGTPAGVGAPPAPTNVHVFALDPTLVRVTWDDGPNTTGYRIYGGEQAASTAAFVANAPSNANTQNVPDRSPNTGYCYSVSAFNLEGESPATGPMCAVTPSAASGLLPPSNVVIFQTVFGTKVSGLHLTWTDRSTGETGLKIYRGDDLVATVGPNVSSYSDSAWTPSLSSCYRVVSINAGGEADSDQACLGSGQGQSPSAPLNVRAAVASGGGLELTWTDTSNDEIGFRIKRDDHLIASAGANATSYIDTKWDAASKACYRVTSFNNFGEGNSESVCPPPGGKPPLPPADLTVTMVPGTRAFRLDWRDAAGNEDGFRVTKNGSVLSTLGPNQSTYTDLAPDLALNCYQVMAFNSAGEARSRQMCL